MNRTYKIFQAVILIFLLPFTNINAQNSPAKGFNIGAEIGIARMLGEIPQGSFQLINEFDHKVGVSAALELSKFVIPKLEVGVETGLNILNGSTNNPEFSAEGNHPVIPDGFNEPVKYQNVLIKFNVFGRYYFKPPHSESLLIPFAELGGGLLSYYSAISYIETGEVIFGKGTEGSTKLSTAVIFAGTGVKTSLAGNKYIVTSIDFNFVNYGFLDVMHNYDENGLKQQVTGIFMEFKTGFFFSTGGGSGKSPGNSSSRKRGNSKSKSSHLPFAN